MERQTVYGVLLETVSIQQYVFGSNKLRENLGASFLVEDLYDTVLRKAFRMVLPGKDFNLTAWKSPPYDAIFQQHEAFDVGYIGGGNALLLFTQQTQAEQFIEIWTRLALVNAPGLTVAVACDQLHLEPSQFQDSYRQLTLCLQQNKARFIPQTVIPRHGITGRCARSGFSLDVWNEAPDDPLESSYVSSVSKTKLDAVDDARRTLKDLFRKTAEERELLSHYTFSDDLDLLGQESGESHIAIVHIDGNGMGKRVQALSTLAELREFSSTVRQATENTFVQLIFKIDAEFSKMKDEFTIQKEKNGQRLILPLRPVILGGDDITFVTDGRLGIYFAECFMRIFAQQQVSDGQPLSSCAGVAIVKTKFPFSQGYDLADALCDSAKTRRRQVSKNEEQRGSWLDFHIGYGGFSGSLETIRKTRYQQYDQTGRLIKNVLFRPYRLDAADERGLTTAIRNTARLDDKFPKSKLKDLRSALTRGPEAARLFIAEQSYRDRTLPRIPGKQYENDGFQNSETPYFDMIELMECYPRFALQAAKEAHHA